MVDERVEGVVVGCMCWSMDTKMDGWVGYLDFGHVGR